MKVGDRVQAKYLASSEGARCPGGWFDGKIKKVNADGTFDIAYEDGDQEKSVLLKYIKAPPIGAAGRKRAAPEQAPEAVAAKGTRVGKRRAVQPQPEPDADPEPQPEPQPERVPEEAAASRRLGKRRAAPESEPVVVEDSEDDAVVEVAGGAASSSRAIVPVERIESDDDEVEITGRSGDLALADFPHAREFCSNKPFVVGKWAERCPNCYCYVCDAPAAECPEWESGDSHCKASHESPSWQAKRMSWRVHGGKPPAAGAVGSSAAAQADGSENSPARRVIVSRWSCDELLRKVQQVYPREEPEPSGFPQGLELRPYQRQSLAFMLDVERSVDAETEGRRGRLQHSKQRYKPRWMPKQSIEWEHCSSSLAPARGGWLCDEVGMGKTAVVAALVLANPARDVKPVSDADFQALLTEDGTPHRFQCTIIVVNNTLVQQWCDELKKFAPSLTVLKYYGDGKKKERGLQDLRSVDVLLTTPHMQMPAHLLAHMRAHRLVVDEAHLLAEAPGNTTTSTLGRISAYQASSVWLVTGTPFSSSLAQLTTQAQLLGQWEAGVKLQDTQPDGYFDPSLPGGGWGTMPNEMVVERLRKLMIRHTKAMRIGGEVALALPDTDCSTEWLDMSADERLMYNLHRCVQPAASGVMEDYLGHCVAQLDACSHKYSEDIVCGLHRSFDAAHADSLGVSKDTYTIQLSRHDSLQRALKSGKVIEEEKLDKLGRRTTVYKYTEGNIPGEKIYSWQPEPKEPKSEREIYNMGGGDEKSNMFPRAKPSLDSPPPYGGFAAASAAFMRTHVKVTTPRPKLSAKERRRSDAMVRAGLEEPPSETVESYQSLESMTKFRALTTDLANLRADEPHFRVIVFTRHSFVQERLVKLIEGEARPGGSLAPEATPDGSKVCVFEFTQKTAPQQRHRLISSFQATGGGARVFIVTYAVAAVGITLTAANRVFLMEPCIDPGQELQAAGRIHRLGQEKDCFIKRFCFRDSIEEAVVALHEKIKAKEINVVDGKVDANASKKALAAFMAGKTTHDHSGARRPRSHKEHACEYTATHEELHGDSIPADAEYSARYSDVVDPGQTKPRKQLHRENTERYKAENWFELKCQQAACVFCGRYGDVPGSFEWRGAGLYGYLSGDTRDPPPRHQYHSRHSAQRFGNVPRPPDGWRGLPLEQTDNGGELPPASAPGPSRLRSALGAALGALGAR